nr:hypothetical protein [uncultured Pedobacter sp.]
MALLEPGDAFIIQDDTYTINSIRPEPNGKIYLENINNRDDQISYHLAKFHQLLNSKEIINLEKQIAEISNMFINNGLVNSVRVTESINYNSGSGTLIESLKALNLPKAGTPLSITTYLNYKNDQNYIQCFFEGNYSGDKGFKISSLSLEKNTDGFKKNLEIAINDIKDLPTKEGILSLLSPPVKLDFGKLKNSNKKRYRL